MSERDKAIWSMLETLAKGADKHEAAIKELQEKLSGNNDSIPKLVLEEWLDDVLYTASNLPSNLYLKNEGMKDAVRIIINHMAEYEA